MAHDEDPKHVYKWEKGINATWESVQEDEFGNIVPISTERDRSHRAKQNRITQSIRRGLIRFLVVAIDCSTSAGEKDYRPSRLEVSKNAISKFTIEYFDQNPISQLSLSLTRDRTAEKITDLSGNAKIHVHKLQTVVSLTGLASLQNTIILGINTLRHIPSYGHRELLIIYNSLSTCDPGDIFQTVKEAKFHKIRISIICLVAEIFICKQVCELTGGIFSVALDTIHLSELLQLHTIPPPELQTQSKTMEYIYMGFPKRVFTKHSSFGFDGKKMELCQTAYICPRCHTKATDIPTQCCVCMLQLNSSSHIARSYHHLFPVCNYLEYVVHVDTTNSSNVEQKSDKEAYEQKGTQSDSNKLKITLKGIKRPREEDATVQNTSTKLGSQSSSKSNNNSKPTYYAICVEHQDTAVNVHLRDTLERETAEEDTAGIGGTATTMGVSTSNITSASTILPTGKATSSTNATLSLTNATLANPFSVFRNNNASNNSLSHLSSNYSTNSLECSTESTHSSTLTLNTASNKSSHTTIFAVDSLQDTTTLVANSHISQQQQQTSVTPVGMDVDSAADYETLLPGTSGTQISSLTTVGIAALNRKTNSRDDERDSTVVGSHSSGNTKEKSAQNIQTGSHEQDKQQHDEERIPITSCRGCLTSLCVENKTVLRCPLCKHFFCVECDLFVHDSLHNCPGCGDMY